ncbi:MAG: peptidase M14 [Betaproteobacteria bacterium]|nr:MAG: peptidase M14 [Betaproteobacteria bacterium]
MAANAQFDPAKVAPVPAAVSQRYSDPDVRYTSPGMAPGRKDFTSHEEVLTYSRQLAAQSDKWMRMESIGKSQQGRDIPLLLLSSPSSFQPDKPTVLILGQQHGNEPAGGEAALALAQRLVTTQRSLLEQVNVVIMPRANPDGAENFVRATANGLDVNRDHLLLQTPEAKAIAATALRFSPQVVMDLHEFTVGGRWLDKFSAYAKYDALLQAATVGNMDSKVGDLALKEFVGNARLALESLGQSVFWYHTSSADATDTVVSMGGVQPDTGRNVYGLRNAVSILIETRGVGLGRAHFARRVHSHVVASLAVIQSAAGQGTRLVTAVRGAGDAAAAQACVGDLVIRAQASPGRETLQFVDAASGADRAIEVEWRSALKLRVDRVRPRPCGYWLAATQNEAANKLRALGVQLQPVLREQRVSAERYKVLAEKGGQRQDARGAIASSAAIRDVTVELERFDKVLPAGGWFVSMNQALANVIAAALEPDSQNSYVANHVLDLSETSILRVMQPISP